MLDVLDFIKERGGDPDKVRASQRKRFAPESVVDEVIELWQDARRSESNWEGMKLCSYGTHSKVRSGPVRREDQRCPEGDWSTEEGQTKILPAKSQL
jgi:hypothetical protein